MSTGLDVRRQVWAADGAGDAVYIAVGAVMVVESVDDAGRPWDSKHASRFCACRRVSKLPNGSAAVGYLPYCTR